MKHHDNCLCVTCHPEQIGDEMRRKLDKIEEIIEMHCTGRTRPIGEIALMITALFPANETANEVDRLRKALEAIRDAPGGGPGRRIATQALSSVPKEGE